MRQSRSRPVQEQPQSFGPGSLLRYLFENQIEVTSPRFNEGEFENFTQIIRTPVNYRGPYPTREELGFTLNEHWASMEYALVNGRKGMYGNTGVTMAGGLAHFFDLRLAVMKGRGTLFLESEDPEDHREGRSYEYLSDVGLYIARKENR